MNSVPDMKKEPTRTRACVEVKALWGNDDADSTIKVSRRRWKQIQEGAKYETSAWSWYEGRRYRVVWRFSDSRVSVFVTGGGDFGGMECVVGLPIEELIVQMTPSE